MLRFILLLIFVTTVVLGQDLDPGCAYWADIGECDNNPGFMIVHCKDSCGRVAKQLLEQRSVLLGKSFFDLSAKDIDGNVMNFSRLKGMVTIIVNVASFCGYTESHYSQLVELWGELRNTEAVTILAFPCNQFGGQEPGTNQEIKEFAEFKGATFDMMDKIDVNGPNTSDIYTFLKASAGPHTITWNFATYFIVGQDGTVQSFSGIGPSALKETVAHLIGRGEEL
jgi:glutathione peroxidase